VDAIKRIIQLALEEDIGSGDITGRATIPAEIQANGHFLAKSTGVISGLEVARQVFAEVDDAIVLDQVVHDGDHVSPGTVLAYLSGPARSLLAGERVALNFVQRLSGVATATARYVDTVQGTRARIIDTRKTTPGMRVLEKEAVRHGGGHNHRFGLADGILIKDNHLAAIGGPDRIARAIVAAREIAPHTMRIEVEVTSLAELDQALAANADVVLLDNMTIVEMTEAVQRTAGRALLEASGGITLETVRQVAETGVDLISSGALTHSAPSLDISLDFELARVPTGD
jgi:nicotinate-nucleotide pyrophosphorylase (carboxylating)